MDDFMQKLCLHDLGLNSTCTLKTMKKKTNSRKTLMNVEKKYLNFGGRPLLQCKNVLVGSHTGYSKRLLHSPYYLIQILS